PRANALLSLALRDGSVVVRIEAAAALAVRGERQRVGDLIAEVRGRSPGRRARALDLLARLPLPETVPPIVEGLTDPVDDVRHTACFAATQLGDAAVLPSMLRLLQDGSPGVREQANGAVMTLTGEEVQPGRAVQELDQRWKATLVAGRRYRRGRPLALLTLVH